MPLLTLKDGGTLHYESAGAGPPLLLVTGLGGLASFWQAHVPPLAERFTVITHDHRGAGRSSFDCIHYSVEQMADDVLQLMDHLGIDTADFVGHSTGGAVGQVLALDHPTRIGRLVLSGSWAGPDPYVRMLFELRADILAAMGPAAYQRASALFLRPPAWLSANADTIDAEVAQASRRFADPEVELRRLRAVLRFDRRIAVPAIEAPTLVIAARDDRVIPCHLSEELGRLIPGARAVMLLEGGHLFPLTARETFLRFTLDFLAAPSGGAP